MGAACLEITYPFLTGTLVGLVLCMLRSGDNSCSGCLNSPVPSRRQLYISPIFQFFPSFYACFCNVSWASAGTCWNGYRPTDASVRAEHSAIVLSPLTRVIQQYDHLAKITIASEMCYGGTERFEEGNGSKCVIFHCIYVWDSQRKYK